jgi:hypothetical protein
MAHFLAQFCHSIPRGLACMLHGMRPRPVQPPDASLEDFTRQLAARFAKERPAAGEAIPDFGLAREEIGRDAEPEAGPAATDIEPRHSRSRALVLSFLLGAVIATACSLYLLHRGSPPTVVATASPSVPASKSPVAPPSQAAMPVEAPAVPAAREEPPPSAPAPISVAPDSAANTNDRDRTLDTRDIREIQTLLQTLGMSPGPADGVAGPLTVAAISRYDQSRGQTSARGLNRELLTRLRQDKATTATRPTPDR